MRQRSISSISVVLVGLVPVLLGGPVFAAFTAVMLLLAWHEYVAISHRLGGGQASTGFIVIALAPLLGWIAPGEQSLALIAATAVGLPLFRAICVPVLPGRAAEWAFASAGTLYMALPAYAFTSLRGIESGNVAGWLPNMAGGLALGWNPAPVGLGWVLFALLIAWMSDTMAFLVGRTIGRHKLVPRISPNKTVEGAIGGAAGAALTGAIGVSLLGLGVDPLVGALLGCSVGILGIVGDLGESLLKREAGIKDSGTLIPGHGGLLDRIDSLLFIITAIWLLVPFV